MCYITVELTILFQQEAHGPHRSPEEEILKIFIISLLFYYYLPLEKDMALHLNKFESLPTKDDL